MRVENWTSRILANAIIGFTRADLIAWPHPLADCQWRLALVEPRLLVRVEGEHQPASIRPDLVLAHTSDYALICECKVGTIQAAQLANYGKLSRDHVADQTHLRGTTACQVCYFGVAPHEESCKQTLQGKAVPLVVFHDDEARLASHRLDEP